MLYKSLTHAQAKLLHAIWRFESSDPTKAITSAELASQLQAHEGFVRKIIADLNKGQEPFVIGQPFFAQPEKRGRPRKTYRLNRDHLVTLPRTARMMLDLIRFPTDGAYRINRDKFEEHVATSYGLKVSQVHGIIERALSTGYIESTGENDIYPSPRIRCEEIYLELIASGEDYVPTKPKHVRSRER